MSEEKPGLGDAVAWLTDKLGIPHCASCEERRKALNALATTDPQKLREILTALWSKKREAPK